MYLQDIQKPVVHTVIGQARTADSWKNAGCSAARQDLHEHAGLLSQTHELWSLDL